MGRELKKTNTIKSLGEIINKPFQNQSQVVTAEDSNIQDLKDKGTYTQWIQRGDKLIPSEEITLLEKSAPGLYTIKYAQGIGFYLFKENYKSDDILQIPTDDITKVIDEVKTFWSKKDVFKKYGLLHKRGILLHGKQGTGKSSLINLIVDDLISNLDGVVFTIRNGRDLEYYAEFMPEYFKSIEPNRPIITILEDLDGLLEYNHNNETLLLNMLDGMEQMENIIYIATTNYPEKLKDRILNRPSRFDVRIEIKPPTADVRRFYLNNKLKEDDLKTVDIEEWVKKSEGFTMAHLKEMIISVIVLGNDLNETVERLKALGNTPSSSQYSKDKPSIGFSHSDEVARPDRGGSATG